MTTPSDVYYTNDYIAERVDNGYPMECHICGKYYYKDDNISELVEAGNDIFCYDCLKDSFTEELFWEYLRDNGMIKEFLEWYLDGAEVSISGWSDTLENALIKGLEPYVDAMWEFTDEAEFARWAVDNEKI